MTPNQTLITFPEFADAGTKTKPDNAKYSAGFVEADVLPAEWLNWFLNKASDGITEVNAGLASIEKELNNLLSAAGKTADITEDTQVVDSIKALRDTVTGTLTNLTTTVKTSLVAAINEVDGDVGTLTSLTTTVKTSLVNAINELVTSIGTLTNLTTTVKTSLVAAVNELVTNQGTLTSLTTTVKTSLVAAINELVTNTGTIASLTTTVKTSLVNAINELVTNQGDLSSLNTTAKTSLVAAINENQEMFKKTYFIQCNSAAGTTNNALTVDNVPAFKLERGVIVNVLFVYACTGTTSPTLNINGTGAKGIYVNKDGSTIFSSLSYHYGTWRGSSSRTNEYWQPYTMLTLRYDGSYWVICGNPILESYINTSASFYQYTLYADGTLEQHYRYQVDASSDTQASQTWTYPVSFKSQVVSAQTTRITDQTNSQLTYSWISALSIYSATFVYRKNNAGEVCVSVFGR